MMIKRCDSSDEDFIALVRLLDADLALRDGDDHAFYAQFNKIAALNHCIVLYENGKAVACGAFRPMDDATVEIKRMYVLPEFRKQGYARKILGALQQWAGELKYRSCILETGKNQPEAIALYASSGFHRIPNYGQYQHVENSVCFSKEI